MLAGAGLFTAGGAGDLAWHEVFGVETGLDALLSPTHLLLLAGGLLAVTGPYRALTRATAGRSAASPPGDEPLGLRAALPAVASLTLATALVAFFLLYLTPFGHPATAEPLTAIPEGAPGHQEAEAPAIVGLGAYLVTTAVLVLPLLTRARLAPPGAATILLTAVAALSAAVSSFAQPGAVPAALLAGLSVDTVLARTRHRVESQARLLLVAAAVPALLWPLQLAALAATGQLRWPIELWLGVLILTTLAAAALAHLAAPTGQPQPVPPGDVRAQPTATTTLA